MRTIFCLALFFALTTAARAQGNGKIEIIRDSRIDSLLKRQKSVNEQKKSVQGYRIQIYFGTQRNKANEIKALFQQKYPSYNAYLIYQQPNFKVRIGDFFTRIEAFKLYKQLQTEYESAFIVKDDIRIAKE